MTIPDELPAEGEEGPNVALAPPGLDTYAHLR
jgi:hypothetical protein